MAAFVVLLALAQSPPSPLDAFQANFASTQAEMDFRSAGVTFQDKQSLWEGKVPKFVEFHVPDRDLTVVGHWACDGAAQYFNYGSPDDVIERASKDPLKFEAGKAFAKVLFIEKTEAIWDGDILVGHQNHPHYMHDKVNPHWKRIQAHVIEGSEKEVGFLPMGAGPFQFPPGSIFPHVLKSFGMAAPERHRAMRWGHPTEVETYRKEHPNGEGWERLEVSYDPSIGYLPRFVRWLTYYAPNDRTNSEEMYLIEARPCKAGGFVPIEWFRIGFDVPSFKKRFPKYDESTDLAPSMTSLPGGVHFIASNFHDFKGPVALKELKDVHSIVGIGGDVKLPAKTTSLTLADMKRMLGKKMTTPIQRVLPHIDMAELRELDRPPSRAWWPFALGAAVAVVLGTVGFLRWRRARLGLPAIVLALLTTGLGLGSSAEPVIALTAAHEETFVSIGPTTHERPKALGGSMGLCEDGAVLRIGGRYVKLAELKGARGPYS